MADSTNHVAVCSSEEVSGVDVDNCGPNPNPNITNDWQDAYPRTEVRLEFGIGG
jgi:hypothetical protein